MKHTSLRTFMKAHKLTELQMATRLGISQPHMNRLKGERQRPSPELAARIERLTGIPFKRLVLAPKNRQTAIAPEKGAAE